jgi:hypothetical protein
MMEESIYEEMRARVPSREMLSYADYGTGPQPIALTLSFTKPHDPDKLKPDSLNSDQDPAFKLNTNPDPAPRFYNQNLKKNYSKPP